MNPDEKTDTLGGSDVSFPLTPALSLGERETASHPHWRKSDF